MRTTTAYVDVVAAAAALLVGRSAVAGATFQPLGDLPGGNFYSVASAVSADGSTVVGNSSSASGREAFRWTAQTGMVSLGDLPGGDYESRALAVSNNGSVVVGSSSSGTPYGTQSFRWMAATEMVELPSLPNGGWVGNATGVSGDGSVVVGYDHNGQWQSYRWTEATGTVALSGPPSGATSVSADGSVIVGDCFPELPGRTREAFRWTAQTGLVSLGTVSADPEAAAADVSADGSVIVGWSGYYDYGEAQSFVYIRAFRWTAEEGMVALDNGDNSEANAVSPDGSLIVGQCGGPVLWSSQGMQDLNALLGSALPPGWTLTDAYDVTTNNGIASIVGTALNSSGNAEAYIATLPIPEPGLGWLALPLVLAARRRRGRS